MLFRKKQKLRAELHQKEREAIIELLHLCLYGDAHIALKEGEFMSEVVDVIGWETQSSFASYEAQSIANARAAKENAELRRQLLSAAALRLRAKLSRELAVELCSQLFAIDGSTAAKEAVLLGEIREALRTEPSALQ